MKNSFNDLLGQLVRPKSAKPEPFVELIHGDCLVKMKDIPNNSIHLVLTDPPYFLDCLSDEWDTEKINKRKKRAGIVGGLPVGMKFDPQQGVELQKFFESVSKEVLRILVPGAFFISFSQPRLSHRMIIGAENSGFEIRDLLAWHYRNKAQFKAFSQDHFVRKMNISNLEKKDLIRQMQGRKTPQLRPQFETMMLAQKPKEGTFVENWKKWKAGLIDATRTLNGTKSPSTLMTVDKPIREKYNLHLTVKPVHLLKHLIELFTIGGQVVCDPFLGSGSTALAAIQAEPEPRSCIGIEINKEFLKIAQERLRDFNVIQGAKNA
ncbi:MAG TPA: site-specific DNA-methyltransferase [Verrucomicrobiae bacterium]|nr:site-specific DNA-methyltransferase [Verrucomicrobiae bacterium]